MTSSDAITFVISKHYKNIIYSKGDTHVELLDGWAYGEDFEEIEHGSYDSVVDSADKCYCGRIWTEHKVIGFWRKITRNSLNKMIPLLNKIKDVNIGNIYDYKIHIEGETFIPIKEFLFDEKEKSTVHDKDAQMLHLMNAKEKANTKQMKSALQSKYDKIGKKLGGTTEAEYNFYKNYGRGENKKRGVNYPSLKRGACEAFG